MKTAPSLSPQEGAQRKGPLSRVTRRIAEPCSRFSQLFGDAPCLRDSVSARKLGASILRKVRTRPL